MNSDGSIINKFFENYYKNNSTCYVKCKAGSVKDNTK